MKKVIKKGLIITGIAIAIVASSLAGGWLLAEKIFGPRDPNDRLISEVEKEKIQEQQREREQQLLEQGIEEARKEHPEFFAPAPSNP